MLFPEAEIAGIATSNVQGTSGGKPDNGLGLEIARRASSRTGRATRVELSGTTDNTYYDDYSSEDDRDWSVEARGRLDIAQPHQHPGPRRP